MQYRTLGQSGLQVSPLCLGAISFGGATNEEEAFAMLDAFVEAGGNFVDTADAYMRGGSEEIIGKWFAVRGNRQKIILATKVGMPTGQDPKDMGLSRERIAGAVKASLRRLQTDYIDLYQTHYADLKVPFEETLEALDALQKEGLVRHAGTSNHLGAELVELLRTSDRFGSIRYVSLQPHYNLINREEFERELDWVCRRNELGVIPFFPLASGFLSGKYRKDGDTVDSPRSGMVQRRYFNDRAWAILDEVRAISNEVGASPAAVSVAWLLAKPAVTAPIVGARNVEQLKDNLTAASVALSPEQVKRLDDVSAWTDTSTRPPGTPPRR